ncbi:MAG: hypothetical protein RL339_2166 [Pseudomonadota bacterium]|jgi:hypothetical protein
MNGDRSSRALARIDAALGRIEAATRRGARDSAGSEELADLQARHDRLRATVTDSLAELDQLIEGTQG